MQKLISIAAVLVLSACSGQSAEPKTVAYYLQHRDELTARIERCKAEKDTGQDCQNASEAAGWSFMGGTRKRVRSISEIEADNANK